MPARRRVLIQGLSQGNLEPCPIHLGSSTPLGPWGLILSRIKATSSLKDLDLEIPPWGGEREAGVGAPECPCGMGSTGARTGTHRGGKLLAQPFHTLPAQKNPAGQLIRRDCGDTGHSQQYLKRTDINFYQNIRAGVGKSHLELAKGSRISSSSHSQCPQGTRNCTGVIISSAFVQVGNKRHFPGPVQL